VLTNLACWLWAAVNVVAMTFAQRSSPVSLAYLITTVSALALFHHPVPAHRPVLGRYHRCSVAIPAAARAR